MTADMPKAIPAADLLRATARLPGEPAGFVRDRFSGCHDPAPAMQDAMTADMPDAVKVAREAVAERRATCEAVETLYGRFDDSPEMKAAILGARAMQDAMAGRVRVKALEWNEVLQMRGDEDPTPEVIAYEAQTAFGTCYTITIGVALFELDLAFEGLGKFETERDAKAAAQADYERRILSALEPAGAQEGFKGFEHCEFIGHPPAPFKAWNQWVESGLHDRLRGVRISAIEISNETINTVRAHAIHNAMQRGVPQAEAEDHFGAPTPAPDVPGLVERLRKTFPCIGQKCARIKEEAADAIEALQAEVEGWRKATWEAREGIVQRDERLPLLMNGWTARATAAEAERDALKAEVERKDKALREAREDILGFTRARGSEYEGTDEDAVGFIDAALSPAKAGG